MQYFRGRQRWTGGRSGEVDTGDTVQGDKSGTSHRGAKCRIREVARVMHVKFSPPRWSRRGVRGRGECSGGRDV